MLHVADYRAEFRDHAGKAFAHYGDAEPGKYFGFFDLSVRGTLRQAVIGFEGIEPDRSTGIIDSVLKINEEGEPSPRPGQFVHMEISKAHMVAILDNEVVVCGIDSDKERRAPIGFNAYTVVLREPLGYGLIPVRRTRPIITTVPNEENPNLYTYAYTMRFDPDRIPRYAGIALIDPGISHAGPGHVQKTLNEATIPRRYWEMYDVVASLKYELSRYRYGFSVAAVPIPELMASAMTNHLGDDMKKLFGGVTLPREDSQSAGPVGSPASAPHTESPAPVVPVKQPSTMPAVQGRRSSERGHRRGLGARTTATLALLAALGLGSAVGWATGYIPQQIDMTKAALDIQIKGAQNAIDEQKKKLDDAVAGVQEALPGGDEASPQQGDEQPCAVAETVDPQGLGMFKEPEHSEDPASNELNRAVQIGLYPGDRMTCIGEPVQDPNFSNIYWIQVERADGVVAWVKSSWDGQQLVIIE